MLDWENIETVLLDMDGTLLDLHFDNYFWADHLPREYAQRHALSIEGARDSLFHHMEQIYGTLDWYCLDYWSDYLDMDVLALKREVEHLIALRPFVQEFLLWLKKKNKRSILITNAHPASLNLKLGKTGLDNWLDKVLSSHDLGVPKEYQRFWQDLQKREEFDPGKTLFIDDTLPILRAARTFGIAHVLGVKKPDSQNQSKDFEEIDAIDDFIELMRVDGFEKGRDEA